MDRYPARLVTLFDDGMAGSVLAGHPDLRRIQREASVVVDEVGLTIKNRFGRPGESVVVIAGHSRGEYVEARGLRIYVVPKVVARGQGPNGWWVVVREADITEQLLEHLPANVGDELLELLWGSACRS